MTRILSLVLIALAMGLVACGGSQETETTPEPATEEPAPEPTPEPEPEPEPEDVRLEGDHITIDQKIHFATGSAEILEDSTNLLNHLATFLRLHNEIATLHVIGHTDDVGDDAANLQLSQARAEAVVAALRERGVSIDLDARGAGETEPVCSETTDECREQNRRVEFVVEMQ